MSYLSLDAPDFLRRQHPGEWGVLTKALAFGIGSRQRLANLFDGSLQQGWPLVVAPKQPGRIVVASGPSVQILMRKIEQLRAKTQLLRHAMSDL